MSDRNKPPGSEDLITLPVRAGKRSCRMQSSDPRQQRTTLSPLSSRTRAHVTDALCRSTDARSPIAQNGTLRRWLSVLEVGDISTRSGVLGLGARNSPPLQTSGWMLTGIVRPRVRDIEVIVTYGCTAHIMVDVQRGILVELCPRWRLQDAPAAARVERASASRMPGMLSHSSMRRRTGCFPCCRCWTDGSWTRDTSISSQQPRSRRAGNPPVWAG